MNASSVYISQVKESPQYKSKTRYQKALASEFPALFLSKSSQTYCQPRDQKRKHHSLTAGG